MKEDCVCVCVCVLGFQGDSDWLGDETATSGAEEWCDKK